MSDVTEGKAPRDGALYRAARYIFQHADAFDQDFCLPDMQAQVCPYSTYRAGEDRDPDVCARCLMGHFEKQERAGLPFADEEC